MTTPATGGRIHAARGASPANRHRPLARRSSSRTRGLPEHPGRSECPYVLQVDHGACYGSFSWPGAPSISILPYLCRYAYGSNPKKGTSEQPLGGLKLRIRLVHQGTTVPLSCSGGIATRLRAPNSDKDPRRNALIISDRRCRHARRRRSTSSPPADRQSTGSACTTRPEPRCRLNVDATRSATSAHRRFALSKYPRGDIYPLTRHFLRWLYFHRCWGQGSSHSAGLRRGSTAGDGLESKQGPAGEGLARPGAASS